MRQSLAVLLPNLVCAAATFASLAPFTSSNFDYFEGMSERKRMQRSLYLSDLDGFQRHLRESRKEILSATEDFLAFKLQSMPVEARISKAIPHSELRLTEKDGHFSILEKHRVQVIEWLLAHF
jgi:hypothetical protein